MFLFSKKEIGQKGEAIATKYLKNKGWKILEKNYHYSRYSEIDIIAKDKDTIVFVEVKTRLTQNCGHPLEAIDTKKLQNIYKAGLSYLQNTDEQHKNFRIDVISVLGLENPQIEHIKNISLN